MYIEALSGREHSTDGRYPRRRETKKVVRPSAASDELMSIPSMLHPALAHIDTRVLVDHEHHVLMVEFVDPKTGVILDSISAQELEREDHHGILVDVAT